ncbi:MAG TPA: hypothetical protein PJ991_12350 [Kiritimatiellia bacterium]|nr:hypothetical protein [Kiritimatiellia bacterium]
MNDDQLKKRLNEWTVNPNIPTSFSHEVWRKIEEKNNRKWSFSYIFWMDSVYQSLQRPAVAITMVALMVIGGLAAGGIAGSMKAEFQYESLKSKYELAINPLNSARMEMLR